MVYARHMRTLVIILGGILSMTACQRPEEPHSRVRSPASAPAATAKKKDTPTAIEATHEARCVVPTPAEPPPTARPAANCPADPLPSPPTLPRGSVMFLDAPQHPSVNVEVARSPSHRQRGLMYRTELAAGQGMLFSWSNAETRSFWMHNTCIPLDMLFIADDGTIAGILEQVPPMNETSRTIPCPARHVLEVPAGYCRQHGVKAGQKIRIQEP